MLSTLDLLIIAAYFALMIALGLYMRNQATSSSAAELRAGTPTRTKPPPAGIERVQLSVFGF